MIYQCDWPIVYYDTYMMSAKMMFCSNCFRFSDQQLQNKDSSPILLENVYHNTSDNGGRYSLIIYTVKSMMRSHPLKCPGN